MISAKEADEGGCGFLNWWMARAGEKAVRDVMEGEYARPEVPRLSGLTGHRWRYGPRASL